MIYDNVERDKTNIKVRRGEKNNTLFPLKHFENLISLFTFIDSAQITGIHRLAVLYSTWKNKYLKILEWIETKLITIKVYCYEIKHD